jgi:UDP-N-acetylmuramate--alanine ligase
MNIEQVKEVYFLGIGGIGMSALARFFKSRGCSVFGYDKTSTPLTLELEAEGMEIHYDEDVDLIQKAFGISVFSRKWLSNPQEITGSGHDLIRL